MKTLILFATLLLAALPVFADDASPNVVEQAKAFISEGKCDKAIPLLEPIFKKSFRKSDGEKSAVLLAECALREGKSEKAAKLAENFVEFYTHSPYRERMEVIQAIAKIETGNVYSGMETLFQILFYSKNGNTRAHIKEIAVHTLAASLLSAAELHALLEKSPSDNDIRGWLELQLGRESQNERRYKAARHWYRRVLDKEKISTKLQETAQKGLASLEGQNAGKPAVLLLVPLSGEFAEFGMAALHGATLALEHASLTEKINLRIIDTKADAFTALRGVQKAVEEDSVIAVVGPIMSAPSATVAAWLSAKRPNIPMITPTATDDGIAQMGKNIFQLNITMAHLAQSIANYAMRCFDIREFAIVAPIGDYGSAMAASFTSAVERRGGKVVAVQNYMEGRTDYKTELDLLRSERYRQLNRKRNIARGIDDVDAINARDRKAFLQDSVAKFPAIFMPSSSPAEAGAMAAQLAFHKVGGMLLGASGWYGRELLINGKAQANGAFFSVPAADAASTEESYKKFAEAYQTKWGEAPGEDHVAVLSYDAMGIVLQALSEKSENLLKTIREKESFRGALGEIRFKNGANIHSKIVGVEKNRFVFESGCPVNEKDSLPTSGKK